MDVNVLEATKVPANTDTVSLFEYPKYCIHDYEFLGDCSNLGQSSFLGIHERADHLSIDGLHVVTHRI